jgi:glycosyltransferase involved in cell wall biosynthesis
MRYRRPIHVIPNPIPEDVGGLSRAPDPDPVILDIGNDTRLKNMSSLIRAFPLVRKDLPRARLRLVGPGTDAGGDLAMWAASQGLDHHVSFLGELSRHQILDEYRRAWVLAHASLEEACPMVLLEALGAGVPAVGGSRSGGVPYVLEWGRRGVLTDVADPARFAEAIAGTLMGGPLAVPGGSDHLARFEPRHVADRYTAWYAETLDAG